MILKVRKHAHGYEEVSLVTKATVLGWFLLLCCLHLKRMRENGEKWERQEWLPGNTAQRNNRTGIVRNGVKEGAYKHRQSTSTVPLGTGKKKGGNMKFNLVNHSLHLPTLIFLFPLPYSSHYLFHPILNPPRPVWIQIQEGNITK